MREGGREGEEGKSRGEWGRVEKKEGKRTCFLVWTNLSLNKKK